MTVESLSFVGVVTGGEWQKPDLWMPKRTGDYATDTAVGRACFEELRQFIETTGNTSLLARVMQAQVRHGEWDAVEIGFALAMADRLH